MQLYSSSSTMLFLPITFDRYLHCFELKIHWSPGNRMGLGGKAAGTTTTKKVFCLFVCFFREEGRRNLDL